MTTTTGPFRDGTNSLPALKFPDVGDTHTFQIIEARQVQDRNIDGDLLTWDDGKPKMVWVFDVDTTLSGGPADASVWVKGNLYTVIREALKAADVPTVGAVVKVTHHALGEPKKKGYNAPKLFEAKAKQGPPIKPKADAFTDDTEDVF